MTQKKDQKQGNILGIGVSSTSTVRVLRFVRGKLSKFENNQDSYRPFFITTPNPEIVVRAQKDEKFKKVLNSSDLSVPDGYGLILASKFLKPHNNLNLIRGGELFESLIKLANKKKWRVFLLGGKGDEADLSVKKLSQNYKSVIIESFAGPIINNSGRPVSSGDEKTEKETVVKINKFSPHLLFVAFGAPAQEKWVSKNIGKLKIGGAMVVGGTFRYVSGRSILPPKVLRNLHLEWMWRLIREPKRVVRIFNAIIVFPLLVIWEKLKRKS